MSEKNPIIMSEDIFFRLTESAFEFLEQSIEEFSSKPKFSTIHFATAVELFLKARLMREHWSLIVQDSSKATQLAFSKGEAKTIGVSEAIGRLRNIAGVSISRVTEQVFLRISKHRNTMIHFVHGKENTEVRDEVLKTLSVDQLQGWWHLKQLLRDWSPYFNSWENRISSISSSMSSQRAFLELSFEHLKPKIDAAIAQGRDFIECASCGLDAAECEHLSGEVSEWTCWVCDASNSYVVVQCQDEDCKELVSIEMGSGMPFYCPACRYEFRPSDLAEQLETDPLDTDDTPRINCGGCWGYGSVIKHDDLYICTECVAITDKLDRCGYCNEFQIESGDLEFSFYRGCEFCDGHKDWGRD